jgi:hypothetical protein
MNCSEWNMISNESVWNGSWKEWHGSVIVITCIANGITKDAITIILIRIGTESGGWAFQFP